MLPKAWATVAGQAERRAAHHEREGFARTAADLYLRAAVMWGRAQYSVFDAEAPRTTAFRHHTDHCVDRLGRLRGDRVRTSTISPACRRSTPGVSAGSASA